MLISAEYALEYLCLILALMLDCLTNIIIGGIYDWVNLEKGKIIHGYYVRI
jgi:hypothetical protein